VPPGTGPVRRARPPGTVEFLRSGSMGRALLGGVDAETSARAVLAMRDTLARHHSDGGVRLEAAIWAIWRVVATR